MDNENKAENAVESVKDVVTAPLPKPPSLHKQSNPKELKDRLNWGEPALTILDVRNAEAWQQERITGAMSMPLDSLVERVEGITPQRDIYVYGISDAETAEAASALYQAGFTKVAEIKGGLDAWKAIAGPTEGISSSR